MDENTPERPRQSRDEACGRREGREYGPHRQETVFGRLTPWARIAISLGRFVGAKEIQDDDMTCPKGKGPILSAGHKS
jgi:hypothetical protein